MATREVSGLFKKDVAKVFTTFLSRADIISLSLSPLGANTIKYYRQAKWRIKVFVFAKRIFVASCNVLWFLNYSFSTEI